MEIKHAKIKHDDIDQFEVSDFGVSMHEHIIKEIVAKDDEHTKQIISEYAMKRSQEIGEKISVVFIDKEIVDEIIELGIQEYKKKHI